MSTADLITGETFQQAWLAGANLLIKENWRIRNLVIHITDPSGKDGDFHNRLDNFAKENNLIGPKHVAYTIFPHKLYYTHATAERLFNAYNRERGLYNRLRSRPHRGWGTYFRRMTHYEIGEKSINQLANIINAIKNRNYIHRAAYTIVIQKPGGETIRPRGGPCLNYIAIQLNAEMEELGLLCLYRNHDYLERAYGNYWGLCNLVEFLANETGASVGSLTVVSSHAYIDTKKRKFKSLIQSLNEIS